MENLSGNLGTEADPWEGQGTGKGSLEGPRPPPLKPGSGGPARQVGGTSSLPCFVLTPVEDQAWWLGLSAIDHPNSFRYFLSLAF